VAFLDLAAQRRPIRDKADVVLSLCAGQSVLDVGCINHSAANALSLGSSWLHRRIRDVAESVTGLDLLATDAAALNEQGYDIVVADAQDFDLGRTFDVVVGADVIEHLTNPGGFLRSARRHMGPDSLLVLTTPNPFAFGQVMQVLLRGRVVVNGEHTMWLDPAVAFELLEREGLEITDIHWIDSDPNARPSTFRTKVLAAAETAVGRIRPISRANYALVARVATR
jgi:2-polyprenyl-3-methyl-5-hydroxy-6-metoxy-1,4-benzoquinol methylase